MRVSGKWPFPCHPGPSRVFLVAAQRHEFGCIDAQALPGISGWPPGSPVTACEGWSRIEALEPVALGPPPLYFLLMSRDVQQLSPWACCLCLGSLSTSAGSSLCPPRRFQGPEGGLSSWAQQPPCLALAASSPQDMGAKDLATVLGRGRESSRSRVNKSGQLVSVGSPAPTLAVTDQSVPLIPLCPQHPL